jgi:two-component system, chemotaxis family, protein-glutamate methylesterase/glutaminase
MSIRVLLVEDSRIAVVILKRILESSPQIKVVGTARTGVEGLALIPETQPDVICTDLHMPQMDGLEFTAKVMALYPRPILVISASVQEEDKHHVFQLLEAGAVDIFPKPTSGLMAEDLVFRQTLINKIEILSGVKVFRRKRKAIAALKPLDSRPPAPLTAKLAVRPKIAVIGASTGGPQALREVLSQLPPDFPLPIICVQHISLGFLQGLIDWLVSHCQLPMKIAQPGERPKPGTVYFPPERQHLGLDEKGRFCCLDLPPVEGHRPSATITFQSVARFYGRRTIGILLSGMGRDGADGMYTIMQAGGFTIAQDESTSVVFGMPKEAIKLGAAHHVLPIQAIAPLLLMLLQDRSLNSQPSLTPSKLTF